jgi:hypothetical protein
MATFQLESFQNEFLPEGGDTVDAIVQVTATDTGRAGPATDRAEIIMIDASGSMGGDRLREAREAAAAAVDCLEDGVRFAVVAGNQAAWRLYPDRPGVGLAVSSPSTRQDARAALRRLEAGGGTAMGKWLELSAGLLAGEAGINHAILLTDGLNGSESAAELDHAIVAAGGVFQCDCRGVGTDWNVSQLRRIATGLLGTVDIVADPSGLVDDFRMMMQSSMARQVGKVALRIWTPQQVEIAMVLQVWPEQLGLGSGVSGENEGAARTTDFDTGAWGDESRTYHVTLTVPPAEVDDEMLAARITLVVGDEPAGQALVRAVWTDDVERSTELNPTVAHYTGQEELAALVAEGMDARQNGDTELASEVLTRALRLSRNVGNQALEARLLQVVDEEPATGLVSLKPNVDRVAEFELETFSVKTVRVKP